VSVKKVESQIAEWRTFVAGAPAVNGHDLDELEDHLRDQIAELNAAGLTDDEAFLVAVKRMGDVDAVSREFAREHSDRLWKQLLGADADASPAPGNWVEAVLFAVAAALVIELARLVAGFPDDDAPWFARNLSLFVLPFLAGYFARRRHLDARAWLLAAAPFALAALVVNVYPYEAESDTEIVVALHLPVVLWFAIAFPYMGGTLRLHERRMDFVRFTGEWFIYYVLIALGGGVLMGLTAGIFEPAGVDVGRIAEWVLPAGAFMLACAAVVYAVTGLGDAFDRDLLSVFDALLLVVVALVLYAMSARDPSTTPNWMDWIQLVGVVGALVLDAMVLGSMVARIGDLGFSPNRTAALGLNVVLFANLAGAALLSVRFVTRRSTLHRLERWQTSYLPVLALWAGTVVVVLPPLFGYS
jgi:hypothetical protein